MHLKQGLSSATLSGVLIVVYAFLLLSCGGEENGPLEVNGYVIEPNANLQKADLSNANLQNADLQEANLQWATLNFASLDGANLQGANLSYASLKGASLVETNLAFADLQWADLQGANLRNAQLQRADLRGADLRETTHDRANFQGAVFNEDTKFPQGFTPIKPGGIEDSEAEFPPKADSIEFEQGFVDLQPVGEVETPTNVLTFSIGMEKPISPGFVTQAGLPQTAFVPNDTPAGSESRFCLSDTDGTHALGDALNYFIRFEVPVSRLSLDLYDYRTPEGPIKVGDTATLTGFSDMFSTIIVFDVFEVIPNLPDGNVANLSIESPSVPIRSASLIFSAGDGGTAIDNIEFTTVLKSDAKIIEVDSQRDGDFIN